jgi:hypothetical protein
LSDKDEVPENGVWEDDAYRDSYSAIDPDEGDYARVLEIINEFLPVKEMAGRLISTPVLRQFALIENEKVDHFLATVFSKSPESAETSTTSESQKRVQRGPKARARQRRK